MVTQDQKLFLENKTEGPNYCSTYLRPLHRHPFRTIKQIAGLNDFGLWGIHAFPLLHLQYLSMDGLLYTHKTSPLNTTSTGNWTCSPWVMFPPGKKKTTHKALSYSTNLYWKCKVLSPTLVSIKAHWWFGCCILTTYKYIDSLTHLAVFQA